MASIVRGILLIAVFIYTSLLYHSTALAHLGYASAVLFILAYAVLAARMFLVKCEIQSPVLAAEPAV